MLIQLPLKQLPRPELTVVSDTNMGHLIALYARVLKARNPLITAPPANSIVWKNAGSASAGEELMVTLTKAINDPFFLRLRQNTDDKMPQGPIAKEVDQQWLIAVINMGMSGLLNFPRSHLKEIPTLLEALTTLEDIAGPYSSVSPTAPIKDALSADPVRIPLAQVILTMNYENIVRSGAFERPTPTDNTVEKAPYGIIERGLLVSVLLQTIALQSVLMRIRPVLRYLRMESSRLRLREEMIPAQVEYWEAIIDRILGLPVTPGSRQPSGRPSLPTGRLRGATPRQRSYSSARSSTRPGTGPVTHPPPLAPSTRTSWTRTSIRPPSSTGSKTFSRRSGTPSITSKRQGVSRKWRPCWASSHPPVR